jgi:SET family sugar efflux transporter-like MFS transporter
MRLIQHIRRGINPVFVSFLLVAFFIGVASALQFPTLSRFLTDEVATPGLVDALARVINPKQFWVGLFFSVSAIVSMIVSFILALRSDRMSNRKPLILFCCVMALANTLLFAFSRNYLLLISVGVLFYALASCIMPQLFALAREYTDYSAKDAAMFSSVMRAQMSLAWVIGPPVSFMLAGKFGFSFMYLAASAVFVLGGLMVYFFLPSVPRIATPSEQTQPKRASFKDKDVVMLFISMVLMWTCNMMYLIDMPIYTDKTLGLSKDLAGYLMGIAAGLEIPFMIMAGYYVRKFGKRRMVIGAVLCGGCFYFGLSLFQSQFALIALQLFNAVFIGIIAGIGMLYFQDLMPGRAGEATTLFSNSATMGIILAGVLQGGLSGSFGHQAVYYLASVFIVVALILCWRVRDA